MTELLRPTIAVVDYDRTRPLIDGRVPVRGCAPIWHWDMPIETMFTKALGEAAFDVAELSFSNFLSQTARGSSAYLGLPIFPSRSFRHGAWFVNVDAGIEAPTDLKGRRVGVREYSMTAAVTARGILEDEYGVAATDIHWVMGDVDESERERISPPRLARHIEVSVVPDQTLLNDMLLDGRIDALLAYKPPRSFREGDPRVRRLFVDHLTHERAYARRTGVFPIMHLIGIRKDIAAAHQWLPQALVDAFTQAKDLAIADVAMTQVLKVSLPWAAQAHAETCDILGENYWAYGIEENAMALQSLFQWHFKQGLSNRKLTSKEVFFSTSH